MHKRAPSHRNPSFVLASLTALALAPLGACAEDPAGDVAILTAPATVCADGPTLFGIDVSKWQGTIDWAKVKAAGVQYAFIRISDGTGYIDAKFPDNWAGAGANGIPRGSYQFFRQDEDPDLQADLVIDHHLQYGMGELPPVIDVESTDGQNAATMVTNIGVWIDRIETELGVRPIIYTGRYFWNDNVGSTAYSDYGLWHPQYTTAECPNIANAWSDWLFWQYSSTGSVNGIAGNVDMNRFNGDRARLLSLVPDEPCRLDPDHRACDGAGIGACADGRYTVTACGAGTVCRGADPHCVDQRCLDAGGEDVTFCLDQRTLALCDRGNFSTRDCGSSEVCADDACEAEVGPVEPGPEVPPETPPEPGPEHSEPNPEVVEPAPDAAYSDVGRPGVPVRTVSARQIIPGDEGCGGGPLGPGLGSALAALLLGATRARSRR